MQLPLVSVLPGESWYRRFKCRCSLKLFHFSLLYAKLRITFTINKDLIYRLEEAFPDVPFQGDDPCCYAVWDSSDVEALFICKTWRQFTAKELDQARWEGTYYFSDEAFTYLLPAYLRASLISNNPDDDIASRFLPIAAIDPSKRNMDLLTTKQREIVCDWLAWWLAVAKQEWHEYLTNPESLKRPDLDLLKEEAETQQQECYRSLENWRLDKHRRF